MPVPGVELLAGAAVGYLVRKARRVAGRADAEVDRVVDEGMDAVHDLVSEVLGEDPAVARLEQQAAQGGVAERSVQRAELAVVDALEDQPEFARALTELIDRLQQHEAGLAQSVVDQRGESGVRAGGDVTATHGGMIVGGNVQGGMQTGPVGPDPTQPGPASA